MRHRLVPTGPLVSTSARTRETWDLVAAAFGKAAAAEFDGRLYEASPEAILKAIKETGTEGDTLIVVGHNPGLQRACGHAGRLGRRRSAPAPAGGFPDRGAGLDQLRRRELGRPARPMAAGWSISSRPNTRCDSRCARDAGRLQPRVP